MPTERNGLFLRGVLLNAASRMVTATGHAPFSVCEAHVLVDARVHTVKFYDEAAWSPRPQ
jgi:hypothetical protein